MNERNIIKIKIGWFDYYIDTKSHTPVQVIENMERAVVPRSCRAAFKLTDATEVGHLIQLLYEFQYEAFKYREYFKENNINNLQILYGDENKIKKNT